MHVIHEALRPLQCLDGSATQISGGCFLFLKNRPGVMCGPCKEQHQAVFEYPRELRSKTQGRNFRSSVAVKGDAIEAAIRSGILVLLSDVAIQPVARNAEGALRQIVF